MEDEDRRDDHGKPSDNPNPDWLVWAPEDIEKYLKKCRTDNAQEGASDRAARRTANATVWIAVLTCVMAGVGFAQWWIQSGTLAEMQAEQRPWIYADITVLGHVYRNQSGGLTVPIGFKLHNVGHLPALRVWPDIEAYLSGERGEIATATIRERQKASPTYS